MTTSGTAIGPVDADIVADTALDSEAALDEDVWAVSTAGFTSGSMASRALHWAIAVPGGLLAALAVHQSGPPENAHLAWVALALFVPVLTLIDAETMYLPNRLVYPTIGLVCVAALSTTAATGDWTAFLLAIACASASFVYYFAIWFFYPGGLGFGDVRLSFAIGMALGLAGVATAGIGAIIVPPLLAVVHALVVVVHRQIKGGTGPIVLAFGPSMAVGALVVMLAYDHLPTLI